MIKKTSTIATLIIAFVFVMSIASCKKDEAINSSSNLIVGKWKMTSFIFNGVDIFGDFPTCAKDNTITFSNTNLLTVDEGATKCDASDPQTETATYTINSNQTKLVVTSNGSTDSISIITLNSTTLKFQELNNNVTTYTKQP